MVDLRILRKQLIEPHLNLGGTAVDYTMGNGNDTLYLSDAVGENGCVYAFDIQDTALANTSELLENNNCYHNYTLIKDSHSNVESYVTLPVDVGIFNLGYLPGGGNKELTTMRETTMQAVESSVKLMADGGIVFISVYPGHDEGKLEGEMIEAVYSDLDRRIYCVSCFKIINSPTSPYFIIIEKNRKEIK
jgi:Predicted S-adenosylmethionine-dependent methyltransferase involved in cell envelope biogenesis